MAMQKIVKTNRKFQIVYLLSFITLNMVASLSGCGSSDSEPDSATGTGGGEAVLPENSAIITWNGPTDNADATSTPLTDLAGYRVYMTTASGVYSAANVVAQISASPTGGGSEDFRLDNLVSGTYYFKVKTSEYRTRNKTLGR